MFRYFITREIKFILAFFVNLFFSISLLSLESNQYFGHCRACENKRDDKTNWNEFMGECMPGISVPIKIYPYVLPPATVTSTPDVIEVGSTFLNFNKCKGVSFGSGFSVCDSIFPPRVTICEPGIYKVDLQIAASLLTASDRDSFAFIYLIDLSNSTDDPIPVSLAFPLDDPGIPFAFPSSFVGVFNFCDICKENPPSFAIKLSNPGGSADSIINILPGSSLIIQKIASCNCICKKDNCCCAPCPILDPNVGENIIFSNGATGTSGATGGGTTGSTVTPPPELFPL